MRIGAAIASLGLTILIACGGSGGFETVDKLPDECGQRVGQPLSDNVAIANEILGESSTDLMFDKSERDSLAADAQSVLDATRSRLPMAKDIHAPAKDRWQVYLKPGDDLRKRVLDQAKTTSGNLIVIKTGDDKLDHLNRQLGLLAMSFEWHTPDHSVYAEVCLSDLANVPVAATAYKQLSSVEDAGPQTLIGDSPALDMREQDGA